MDFGQELLHRRGRARHLAAQRVRGEARLSVQARELLAQLEDIAEEREVGLPALAQLGHVVAMARRPALRVRHERAIRRVVEAHHVAAVLFLLVGLEVGLGHPLHFRRREGDGGGVVAHVAVVGLAQLLELVEDGLGACALVRGQRHAAVLEALDQVFLQLGLVSIGRLHREHAPVELLVLEDLGVEGGELLQAGLGGVAHRLVRAHAAQQVDRVHHVLDRDLGAVPLVEDRPGAAPSVHRRDRAPRARESVRARPGETGRVVDRHVGMLRGPGGERGDDGRCGEQRGQGSHCGNLG